MAKAYYIDNVASKPRRVSTSGNPNKAHSSPPPSSPFNTPQRRLQRLRQRDHETRQPDSPTRRKQPTSGATSIASSRATTVDENRPPALDIPIPSRRSLGQRARFARSRAQSHPDGSTEPVGLPTPHGRPPTPPLFPAPPPLMDVDQVPSPPRTPLRQMNSNDIAARTGSPLRGLARRARSVFTRRICRSPTPLVPPDHQMRVDEKEELIGV
jgi:hypothetical protein